MALGNVTLKPTMGDQALQRVDSEQFGYLGVLFPRDGEGWVWACFRSCGDNGPGFDSAEVAAEALEEHVREHFAARSPVSGG